MKFKNNISNAINYFIEYITPVPIQIVAPCPMLFLSYLQIGLLDVHIFKQAFLMSQLKYSVSVLILKFILTVFFFLLLLERAMV